MTISAEEIEKWNRRLGSESSPAYEKVVATFITRGDLRRILTYLADMKAEMERLMVLTGEYSVALDDARIAFEEKNTRIAALEAQLAERDARISVLEVAAVKAVLPLEAMNISGVAKRFDEETTLAILDGISSVRAAICARSEQEGK